MLNTFSLVSPFLKLKPQRVSIDNIVFRLHYRWTFIILLIATVLVCSRQYIGEHIKCISHSIPSHVINTYCFFTTTFTVVRHLNNTALAQGAIFEPGIGPYLPNEEPIKRHAYYQWVPFVLFAQALCFYIPHFLWKRWEGGGIRALVYGLRMCSLSRYVTEHSLEVGQMRLPTLEETEQRVLNIKRVVIERMILNRSWGLHLIVCECLNLFNLVVQIFWTNRFLAGAFYDLGLKVLNERWTEQMDVLDVVFPKVTKCHFYKYGPSGSLQVHDTLCVMALNIVNEKVFTIIWFWYAVILVATVAGLIWRLCSIFFHRSNGFTRCALYMAKPGHINRLELEDVVKKCNFSNWLYLYFLRANLSEFLFQKVIHHLASDMPDPLNGSSDNLPTYRFTTETARDREEALSGDLQASPLLKVKGQ